ncbi:MAG: hypothetical protein Q9163_003770 [Psora crenata]
MAPAKSILLNKGWTFQEANSPQSKPLEVQGFPTVIHLDLMHHGLIPNPLNGTHEIDVQWVGEKAWIYRTTFPSPKLLPGEKAVLAFDGLDTFATVELNGRDILQAQNMFIPKRIDVTEQLSSQAANSLDILFESAYVKGKKIMGKHPDHRWGCWNGDPSRLAVRKAQYHYV